MTDTVLLYITCADQAEAKRIGRALVEARLIACANVMAPHTAVYRWEDAVQEDPETVLIAKTRADRVDAVTARVTAIHSYDCPCVVALPIVDGARPFLDWISAEVQSG